MERGSIQTGLWIVGAVAAGCFSCTASPAALPTVQDAGGQATADARISTTSPLIVEWPAAERGRLEAQMGRGAVAVRYEGATLELLPDCKPDGAYAFSPMVPKSEHLIFGSALDLDASFPLGAARLGARLEAGKQLELTTRLVGRWEIGAQKDSEGPRDPSCAGATHIISAATVGAFRFYSSARSLAGAGAEVAAINSGLRGGAEEQRSIVNADGSPDKCGETSAVGPPRECGALIRLELSSFENPRSELLHELGTLDFTPIEKRLSSAGLEAEFTPILFPQDLCEKVKKGTFGSTQKSLQKYCQRAEETADKEHSSFPEEVELDALRKLLSRKETTLGTLLLIDGAIRLAKGATPELIEQLQTLADEKTLEDNDGYFARYLLAGCGSAEIEERNLRELIRHGRLSSEPWPRMRLANHMLSRDRVQAVTLAQTARSLASMCSEDRLDILDWLGAEGSGILSSGELFDVQLDAVLTLSGQGKLPSTSPLGQRAIRTHDFQTWDASKKELAKDQWALGALYWAEGAECLFRGNHHCATMEWRELLEKAPHSPYVLPAYHALLRVTGKADPARLAALSALRPHLEPGSKQRQAIAEQPACKALSDKEMQRVLDEAQELALLQASQLRGNDANWEVDSLSAIAPDLSSCAVEHPSNGKSRLLKLRVDPSKKRRVRVTSADQSPESKNLSQCVQTRTSGNASLFSTPFQVTIRVAPEPSTSFDYGQGWARHIRERFSCTAGDDEACIRLGKAWLEGGEMPREPEQALAIFSAKCGEGNQMACVEEALLRTASSNSPAQINEGRKLLEEACEAGQGQACRHLAEVEEARLTKKLDRYRSLLRAGCQAPDGDAASCVELWYAGQEGVLPPHSVQDAHELLQAACKILGHGVVQGSCGNPRELMQAYPHRAGAALGQLTCKHSIWQGCESAFNEAIGQDKLPWARAACKHGSPDACAWVSETAPGLTRAAKADLVRRTLHLCRTAENTGHESVCDDPKELEAQLKVLEWTKKAGPRKKGNPSPYR